MSRQRRQSQTEGRGGQRWRVAAAVAIVAVCGVILAEMSEAAPAAKATVAAHRSATTRIVWKGCGKGLQCARVAVPLDWSNPRGPQISLAVIRHRASGPGRRIGSLFLNWGGPGVAGVAMVKAASESDLDALGGVRFDLVSWDPRGTGESTHVRCFANDTVDKRFRVQRHPGAGRSLPWRGAQTHIRQSLALAAPERARD